MLLIAELSIQPKRFISYIYVPVCVQVHCVYIDALGGSESLLGTGVTSGVSHTVWVLGTEHGVPC